MGICECVWHCVGVRFIVLCVHMKNMCMCVILVCIQGYFQLASAAAGPCAKTHLYRQREDPGESALHFKIRRCSKKDGKREMEIVIWYDGSLYIFIFTLQLKIQCTVKYEKNPSRLSLGIKWPGLVCDGRTETFKRPIW